MQNIDRYKAAIKSFNGEQRTGKEVALRVAELFPDFVTEKTTAKTKGVTQVMKEIGAIFITGNKHNPQGFFSNRDTKPMTVYHYIK